jgi:hypothetical protein
MLLANPVNRNLGGTWQIDADMSLSKEIWVYHPFLSGTRVIEHLHGHSVLLDVDFRWPVDFDLYILDLSH